MKTLVRILSLLALTACGAGGLFGGSSSGNSSIGNAINEARSLAGSTCSYVGPFHFRGQLGASSIMISSQATGPAGGSVDNYYVGTNSFGDLIVVSKMNTGEHDIAVMLCYLNNTSDWSGASNINSTTSIVGFQGYITLHGGFTNERRGTATAVNSYIYVNTAINSYYGQQSNTSYTHIRSFYSPSGLSMY